jgi:hypothetical protein
MTDKAFQSCLSKNRFPGSRQFPENCIFIPAFPGMSKKFSRGNTTRPITKTSSFNLWQKRANRGRKKGVIEGRRKEEPARVANLYSTIFQGHTTSQRKY